MEDMDVIETETDAESHRQVDVDEDLDDETDEKPVADDQDSEDNR